MTTSPGILPLLPQGVGSTILGFYAAAISPFTPAATPTDIATIAGSSLRTICVEEVVFTVGQSTAALGIWDLVKRSTANTGGTSAAVTSVPLDANDGAATGSVLKWTANPGALGTVVGAVGSRYAAHSDVTGAATQDPATIFDFSGPLAKPVFLRGTAQQLALNFRGAAVPAGMLVSVAFRWFEF